MKRRGFIKNMGLGVSAVTMGAKSNLAAGKSTLSPYRYPVITNLEDALNDEGLLMLRLEFGCIDGERLSSYKGKIEVINAEINRIKEYFFEQEDQINVDRAFLDLEIASESTDIVVLWLEGVLPETEIIIKDKNRFSFYIKELLSENEKTFTDNNTQVIANLLFDKEIGEISLKDIGCQEPGKNYLFTVMADPQGGDAFSREYLRTRMRIHNAFIEESVSLINRLNKPSLFTMVVGDVTDDWGYAEDFIQMNKYLKKINNPVLLEIGNHETELRLKFSPGYNMEGFNNFFAAQKELNGLDKLLYSFNAGEWHYIVWPDPLRPGFWETHPHYFDWLERDLEKNKNKPVMVFQHVPLHPVGINPLINYAESVFVKRTFIDILARHGNVKYILSGHVHIPIKSSVKTAVEIKGIKLINLPAAGYRPRSFGESDYFGGPTQGIAIVKVTGKDAKVIYKNVTDEEFPYPDSLPKFNDTLYPLWFRYKWELPATEQFVNGNFEEGLKGWGKRFVYEEDDNPSNICEVRSDSGVIHGSSLYMLTKRRDYMAPGQDRLPQDINRIFQAVKCAPEKSPVITFSYKLDGTICDFSGHNGMFAWIEGYSGSVKKLNLMYSANWIWVNIGGKNNYIKEVPPVQLALNNKADTWHAVEINVKQDTEKYIENARFDDFSIDRLVLSFGIWNINDGREQPFAAWFDEVKLAYNDSAESNINGIPIREKPDSLRWWRGKDFDLPPKSAGEHRYWIETERRFNR